MEKSRSKKGFILLLLLLLIISYFAYRWYQQKKNDTEAGLFKPDVQMSIIKINSITPETTDMEIKLLIDNPIPAGVTMRNLKYKIYIAGTEVMHSTYGETVTLKGNDSSFISLPVLVAIKKH